MTVKMKVKRVLKYLLFLLTIAGLGFLYSFSSTKNQQKKISEIIVEFEEGENHFLSHSMVNKLLIQNIGDSEKPRRNPVINLHELENVVFQNPLC